MVRLLVCISHLIYGVLLPFELIFMLLLINKKDADGLVHALPSLLRDRLGSGCNNDRPHAIVRRNYVHVV